jgi:hypothetical protein
VRYWRCIWDLLESADEALYTCDGARVYGYGVQIEEVGGLVGHDLLQIDISGLVDEVCDLREEGRVLGVLLKAVVETSEELVGAGLG